MTNTRITDPEILERRYPVILREFSLRKDSGGLGLYNGGNGIVRDIEFLEDGLQISILSERRVFQPYGIEGGQPGACGKNLLMRKSNQGGYREINFSGKNSTIIKKGDRIRILTPGGGGYGSLDQAKGKRKGDDALHVGQNSKHVKLAGGSLGNYIEMQNSV